MKAIELLTSIKDGKPVTCDTCQDKIPSKDILEFNFKLGKLAPRMEDVCIGSIVCVECQKRDELIQIEPRGPDIKFVRG